MSELGAILRGAIAETPGALAGAFAAADGEAVDLVGPDRDDAAFAAAHVGVLIAQVRLALGTFHFGDPLEVLLLGDRGAVVAQVVGDGYFAMLELARDAPLPLAQRALGRAVVRLRQELA